MCIRVFFVFVSASFSAIFQLGYIGIWSAPLTALICRFGIRVAGSLALPGL